MAVVSELSSVRDAVEEALVGIFSVHDRDRTPRWTLDVRRLNDSWRARIADASKVPRLVLDRGNAEEYVLHFSTEKVVIARPEGKYGGAFLLEADHRARRSTLHISSDTVRDLRWVPRVLRQYFGALLQSEGCLFVHAAAVEWNGRGILFGGSGGSGKTSLTFLACSRLGARFLSDDITVIQRRDDGNLQVFGWPRRVALGLSILQHESAFAEIRRRSLRRQGLDYSMPSEDALSEDWGRHNRVAFDPAEFLQIFSIEAGTVVRPDLVVLPKARAEHQEWTVRSAPGAAHEGLDRCGITQMQYLSDFLGVTPYGRPWTDDEHRSRLEMIPAVQVTYGPSVTADFERFWEDVICRNLPTDGS